MYWGRNHARPDFDRVEPQILTPVTCRECYGGGHAKHTEMSDRRFAVIVLDVRWVQALAGIKSQRRYGESGPGMGLVMDLRA